MSKWKSLLLVGALGYGGGLLTSRLTANAARRDEPQGAPSVHVAELRGVGSAFVRPLLDCATPTAVDAPELDALHARLSSAVDAALAKGSAERVSVYYRDLSTGLETGVRPEQRFNPASMLKVATLMATYKGIEEVPTLLATEVPTLERDKHFRQNILQIPPMEPGKTYPVHELLDRMILHSDNDAVTMLNMVLGFENVARTYTDLGLEAPVPNSGDREMSPREIGVLFRALYNGAYLGTGLSERALELLTHVDFQKGLVAGVPAGTRVAHKFGERSYLNAAGSTDTAQLHDCGIIYAPDRPYVLCVMTLGIEYAQLQEVIRDISAAAWGSR